MSTPRTHFEHREIIRDVRPLGKRISDHFMSEGVWLVLAVMGGALVIFPGLTLPVLLFAPFLFWYGQVQINKYGWPLKAPVFAGVSDPADLNPVTGKMRQGEGVFLLGWERFTGRPLYLTNSDLRAHLYLLGVSGAGKTETLMGFVWNAMMLGTGLILIDGKGEIVIPSRVIAMARAFLREDDVLIVNFQTGGKDRVVADKRRTSNIANLLAIGASTELSEMMTALLDSGPNTDQMWLGRTESLIKALMPSLVWLRDHANEPLSPSRFRSAVELREILRIYGNARIPWRVRAGLEGYLKTLPGGIPKENGAAQSPEELEAMKANYRQTLAGDKPPDITDAQHQAFRAKIQAELQALEQGKPPSQDANEATREEQHGYVIMQLTKSLGIMADIYWYITDSSYTEIDWVDVALNRRIVIVLLPTLGLSKQGAESLGKIVTASVKAMMNRVLGDTVERREGDPRFKTLTQGDHPYFIIFDEKPAYIVDGEDVIATQARSLGFSVSYGAQAHSHMLEKNQETAKAIAGAATRTKIIAGVEDYETMEMAIKLGGEVWKPVQNAYEYNLQSDFGGGIRSGPTISVQKEALVNVEELKSQKEGQAHIFMALQRKTGEIQRVIKANMIYVVPKEPDAIHIQHFIPLIQPDRLQWSPLQVRHPITGMLLVPPVPSNTGDSPANVSPGSTPQPAAASVAAVTPESVAASTTAQTGRSGTNSGLSETEQNQIYNRIHPSLRAMLDRVRGNITDPESIDAAFILADRMETIQQGIRRKLPALADAEGRQLYEDVKQVLGPHLSTGGGV